VVDGQTHGNIALGVGQALLEEVVYDADGRILTDSYGTYPIPRAMTLPNLETARTETPTKVNPIGAKGAGDVSNPPVAPAIVNAILDALADLGVRSVEMPATPERVWRAMNAGAAHAAKGAAGKGASAKVGARAAAAANGAAGKTAAGKPATRKAAARTGGSRS
jgi:xanthine dehydrogenase molybdopterin-binding subunit B